MAHFIYPTGRRLFRAGIGESATGPLCAPISLTSIGLRTDDFFFSKSSPPAATYDKPGLAFNRLIAQTGCAGNSRPVDCLRAVPFGVSGSIEDFRERV
jgi:hypothetical protein